MKGGVFCVDYPDYHQTSDVRTTSLKRGIWELIVTQYQEVRCCNGEKIISNVTEKKLISKDVVRRKRIENVFLTDTSEKLVEFESIFNCGREIIYCEGRSAFLNEKKVFDNKKKIMMNQTQFRNEALQNDNFVNVG